jgi:hypothetical protein
MRGFQFLGRQIFFIVTAVKTSNLTDIFLFSTATRPVPGPT